jgi:hypothetical protein
MDSKDTWQKAYAILWAPLILHSYSILAANWLSSLWVLDSNIVCKRDCGQVERIYQCSKKFKLSHIFKSIVKYTPSIPE